ncbi:GGDEF domain-containing protein [Vibrio sp. AH4]|uniref:GGDEF domain-containing protein n=1 Tax=Vibrio sp. AH4 TaxID=2919577 RepID=UPI0027391A83|nr:GGDEF domain-containing protein [Vibrio sp. AH4]MDP4492507.1 GGDEF domain-containing protein [Vibrio sp. AH4]
MLCNVFCRFVLLLLGWLVISANVLAAPQSYVVATEADDVVTRVLFDSIAYHFNLEIEYVNYPSFNHILMAIESGQADFAANVTYTEPRAQRFDFSSPTNIEYTYLYSYGGLRLNETRMLGIPKGTIYGDLVRQHYPYIQQIEYQGHQEAVALLESRRVDGVIDAINQLKPMLLKGVDAQLLNDQVPIQPVSIIAPKGKHLQLLNDIQQYAHSAYVQRLLRESIQRYQFDIRKQALRQAVVDSGLNVQRVLRVKLENNPQYALYQPDGSVRGISADVVFQACEMLLLKCELVSHGQETWESMFADLQEKKIDILAPVTISPQRKNFAYFSESYYHPEAILVKREHYKDDVYSNVSELVTERIGVINDDFFEELLQQMLPNKKLFTYSNQQEKLQALLNKEVDYIVLNRANFNLLLRESKEMLPIVEDTMIGAFYQYDIAIGFSKNPLGATLAPLFSRAIKMLNTEQIIHTYDYQPNWRATLLAEKKYQRSTQWLFALALLALFMVAFYLHGISHTDNLTKLRNRRALYNRYRRGLSPRLTLVYLDVNKFKSINDQYGHEVGDKVLKQLSQRIENVWRGRSYRIGGDEFILIGECSVARLEYVQAQCERFMFVDAERDVSFEVSVAIGVAKNRERTQSLNEVMHQADIEMYRAKAESTHQPLQSDPKVKRLHII